VNAAPANAELIDRLAAEYVLGTLRGAARQRFERWRQTSPTVDGRCGYWEEQLLPLLATLTPVAPAPHVWARIRSRVHGSNPGARRSPFALALAASLVLIACAALFLWRTQPAVLESATIASPSGALLWRVEVSGRQGTAAALSMRAGRLEGPPGRDYELWALPSSGAPVSLGVLPYRGGVLRTALTPAQRAALAASSQIAVTLEAPGGSPNGKPTSAPVFVAALRAAG
jgi:anti-sigma-K factor RskA